MKYRMILALTAGITLSCASMNVEGSDWYLEQVTRNGTSINIDRETLIADGMADWLTVRFENGRMSGRGAPNRFTADCTVNSDGSLSIGLIAATKMMAFKEPAALKEQEYFDCLEGISQWKLPVPGRLELSFTSKKNGQSGMLIFGLKP